MNSFVKSLQFRFYGRTIQRIEDIYSYALIKDFLPDKTYFPITGSSLGFHASATIINDIEINKRCRILEFGSGLSTIMLAKYAKRYNSSLRIVSVEHDAKYLQILQDVLIAEGLAEFVIFVTAELRDLFINNVKYKWYSSLETGCPIDDKKFDLVIIDGPISDKGNRASLVRYPALEFLKQRIESNYSIYLDDVHRISEQKLIKMAREEYNIIFRKISPTLAVANGGSFYNSIP